MGWLAEAVPGVPQAISQGGIRMMFKTWFREQYGKRPTHKTTWDLKAAFDSLQAASWEAEKLWKDVADWDAKCSACLMAWQAAQGKEEDQ